MNKKQVYLCVSLLAQYRVFFGAEEVTPENPIVVEKYVSGSFAKQIHEGWQKVVASVQNFNELAQNQYNYKKESTLVVEEKKMLDNNSCDSQKPLAQEKQPLLTLLKKHSSEINLTLAQKYVIVGVAASLVVAGVIYKYGLFSSKKNLKITAYKVQKLVESVVQNSTLSKQDQLHKIFELLIRNGLEDIVVYNDHVFQINDQFKVEINGRLVKVTCL